MKRKWRALAGTMAGVLLMSSVSFAAFADDEVPVEENQVVEEMTSEENQEPETVPEVENQELDVAPQEENQVPEYVPTEDVKENAGEMVAVDDEALDEEAAESDNALFAEGIIEDASFSEDDEFFTAADITADNASVKVVFIDGGKYGGRLFDSEKVRTYWNSKLNGSNRYYFDPEGRWNCLEMTETPDADGKLNSIFNWTPECADYYMLFDGWFDDEWESVEFRNGKFVYTDTDPEVPVDFSSYENNELWLYARWKLNTDLINESNRIVAGGAPMILKGDSPVVFGFFEAGDMPAYHIVSSITSGTPCMYLFTKKGFWIDSISGGYLGNENDLFYEFEKGYDYEAGDKVFFVITQADNTPVRGTVTLNVGAHSHVFGEWIVETPAAVGRAGERYKECIVCGEQVYETIPALSAPQPAPVVQTPPADPITINKAPMLKSVKQAKKGSKAEAKLNTIKKPKKTKKKGKKAKKTTLWDQVKRIEIQYSTDPSFATGVITKTLGKQKVSVNLGGLKKGVTYYVRARYVGNGGYSNWSATKTVKVKNQKKGKKR